MRCSEHATHQATSSKSATPSGVAVHVTFLIGEIFTCSTFTYNTFTHSAFTHRASTYNTFTRNTFTRNTSARKSEGSPG
jgi:hypothetical protein